MIKGEKEEKKDENQHPEYLINMQIFSGNSCFASDFFA